MEHILSCNTHAAAGVSQKRVWQPAIEGRNTLTVKSEEAWATEIRRRFGGSIDLAVAIGQFHGSGSPIESGISSFRSWRSISGRRRKLYSVVYKSKRPVSMLQATRNQYNAEISAGSLMPLESKRIAALLLANPDAAQWLDAIEVQNILQKKTPATARRQATLIRKRLMTLDPQGWEMIATRENEVANQLLLAASIKHSYLLGDFFRLVYALRQRGLEPALAANSWHDFLTEITHHDAAVANWSDSTKAKLFQVIVRILAETKFLESARSMRITPQALHPDVARYLRKHHETYVLECLERTA
jgi:Putative inner membrane protein (DUF1819)